MSSSSYLRVVHGSPSALLLNLFSIFSLSNWSQSHHGLSSQYSGSCSCEVKVAQLCPTLCISMNYTVHGILQARILEWIAFPFSRGSFRPRNRTGVSCVAGGFFTSWLFAKCDSVSFRDKGADRMKVSPCVPQTASSQRCSINRRGELWPSVCL